MVKVYLPKSFVKFEPTDNPRFWLYAKWAVRPHLKAWLSENCHGRWIVSSDDNFTWQMYDTWLNDSIDLMLRKTPIDSLHDYNPYSKCRPYICFDYHGDAVLFKLTW